jgi:hypothetical protein
VPFSLGSTEPSSLETPVHRVHIVMASEETIQLGPRAERKQEQRWQQQRWQPVLITRYSNPGPSGRDRHACGRPVHILRKHKSGPAASTSKSSATSAPPRVRAKSLIHRYASPEHSPSPTSLSLRHNHTHNNPNKRRASAGPTSRLRRVPPPWLVRTKTLLKRYSSPEDTPSPTDPDKSARPVSRGRQSRNPDSVVHIPSGMPVALFTAQQMSPHVQRLRRLHSC